MSPTRRTLRITSACSLAAFAGVTWAASVPAGSWSAPQIESVPAVARTKTALVVGAEGPALRVELPVPSEAELASLPAFNARRSTQAVPLAVGFGRDVPVRDVALASLPWTPAADGARVARIDVVSPGAAALRVALVLPRAVAGLSVRFASTAADATAFGDETSAAIAEATVSVGRFWSPVLAGSTAIIELRLAAGAPIPDGVLSLPRVSHQVVTGRGLLNPLAKTGVGASGSCNVDVACLTPPSAPVLSLAKAVAKLTFVGDDGRGYLCTGTLVADTVQSKTPYLLTANHCIDSAAVARTINSFWFFEAAACNSMTPTQFVQLNGGADLLGRSPDRDWALVRLREAAPGGATFAAWRADTLATGAAVATIHHPEGDLKKWSAGTVTGTQYLDDGYVAGRFTEVVWKQGVTEGGSSGGALVTLAAGGGFYEVRGGLYGGLSQCSRPTLPDYYAELGAAVPAVRQYLAPDAANPTNQVAATEFYNATLDHYFLSTNPVEIAKLDSGATVGWVRTGLRFVVHSQPATGTTPVCRFYRAPAFGDSHFYSASPAECAATAAAHPVDWIYESPSVFHVMLPNTTTGACAAGTKPVYRFFNTATTNHRYTAEIVTRNTLASSPGWTAEGYGPGPHFPVMCAFDG